MPLPQAAAAKNDCAYQKCEIPLSAIQFLHVEHLTSLLGYRNDLIRSGQNTVNDRTVVSSTTGSQFGDSSRKSRTQQAISAWSNSPNVYSTVRILTATYQSHVKHSPNVTSYQLNREWFAPIQASKPEMAQLTRLVRPGFAAYKQQLEHIEKRGACYRVYVTRPDIKLGSVWVVQTNLAWT